MASYYVFTTVIEINNLEILSLGVDESVYNGIPFTIRKIPIASGSRTLEDPLRREVKVNDFRPARTEALTNRLMDG